MGSAPEQSAHLSAVITFPRDILGGTSSKKTSSFARRRTEERERTGLVVGLGTRVGDHREVADLVLNPLSLAVLLGLANPCDLCIDRVWQIRMNGRKKK